MKTTLRRAALLVLLAVAWAAPANAGSPTKTETILPEGGKVTTQGKDIEIFDKEGRRIGYGIIREDGSLDLFNVDGTRRATLTQQPGGPARVTTPK